MSRLWLGFKQQLILSTFMSYESLQLLLPTAERSSPDHSWLQLIYSDKCSCLEVIWQNITVLWTFFSLIWMLLSYQPPSGVLDPVIVSTSHPEISPQQHHIGFHHKALFPHSSLPATTLQASVSHMIEKKTRKQGQCLLPTSSEKNHLHPPESPQNDCITFHVSRGDQMII